MAKLRGFRDGREKTISNMIDMAIKYIDEENYLLARAVLVAIDKSLETNKKSKKL